MFVQNRPNSEPNRQDPRVTSVQWDRAVRTLITGLAIGLIGGVAVGFTEALGAAGSVWRDLHDQSLPLQILAATVGRAMVSHVLLWCPVMLAISGLIAGVRALRRNAAAAGWLLAGMFAGLAGIVTITGDLGLIQQDTTTWVGLGAAAASLSGLAVMWLGSRLSRRLGPVRSRRALQGASAGAAFMLVLFAIPFVRSPFFDPSHWRVAHREAAPPRPGPHVLWILLDTVRADRMGLYGYEKDTTPFLEKWGQSAVVFEEAHCNGMWTVPSHGSMFTGLPARVHGANFHHLWLDDEHLTLAEVLRDAGYATAAFTNNSMASQMTNMLQGFDVARNVEHLRHLARVSKGFLLSDYGFRPPVPWMRPDLGAALTSQLVDEWLTDAAPRGKPIFLFVNLLEAHVPYRVPGAYRREHMKEEHYRRSYELRSVYGNMVQALDVRFNTEGGDFFPESDREVARSQYDAAIRYLDDRTEELVRLFEQHGLLDDTIVIISSDHGEYLGEHDLWAHRCFTYREVAHVPLVIREPGRTEGLRVTTPVQPSDVFGTVLRAALGSDGGLCHEDARDLLELANRAGAEGGAWSISSPGEQFGAANPAGGETSRVAVTEYFGPEETILAKYSAAADESIRRRAVPQVGATDGRYKVIRSADGRDRAFDLTFDPRERHNLITAPPAGAAVLLRYLDDWTVRVKPRSGGDGRGISADPALMRALRGLGYIDSEP